MNEENKTLNRPLLNNEVGSVNLTSNSITGSMNSLESKGESPRFFNYDEKEEATCIKQLTFLKFRPLMYYFVVPLMSVCTFFILAICLYWLTDLRMRLLYTKVSKIEEATHLLVHGLEGNVDIVPLLEEKHIVFTYRFIKFEYVGSLFRPIIFNTYKF